MITADSVSHRDTAFNELHDMMTQNADMKSVYTVEGLYIVNNTDDSNHHDLVANIKGGAITAMVYSIDEFLNITGLIMVVPKDDGWVSDVSTPCIWNVTEETLAVTTVTE